YLQADDGIRDRNVTGVQTCALPIFLRSAAGLPPVPEGDHPCGASEDVRADAVLCGHCLRPVIHDLRRTRSLLIRTASCSSARSRSEERRVGKERGVRWARRLTHETG